MIKKVFIIFTFILIIFNIAKVEAMSILTNSEENQITKEYSVEDETERGNSRLTIEVRDLEDCVRIANAKVLIENKNGTWKEEYITDEEGFIYIKGLNAGEFNIQVLEVPEKYILDEMVYTVAIGENSFQGQLIGVYHKVGELLIKCYKKGVTFEVITENCFGTYTSDDKGEVCLKNLIVGNCKITPYPLEGDVIGETVETEIEENKLTEVVFFNASEDKEQEEEIPKDNIDKEQEDDKDNENEDKEAIPEDNNQQNSIKEENNEKKEEVDNNKENEKIEDNSQSIKKEEIKIDKPAIIYTPEEKEKNNNANTEKETENKKQEENIKEDEEKQKTEEKQDKGKNKIENTELAGNQILENQSNQTKLPKTGNDYFEVKLIIFNSIIFIVFISIMYIHKKRQTNNSLPCRRNYKIIQINPPLPSLTIRSKVS